MVRNAELRIGPGCQARRTACPRMRARRRLKYYPIKSGCQKMIERENLRGIGTIDAIFAYPPPRKNCGIRDAALFMKNEQPWGEPRAIGFRRQMGEGRAQLLRKKIPLFERIFHSAVIGQKCRIYFPRLAGVRAKFCICTGALRCGLLPFPFMAAQACQFRFAPLAQHGLSPRCDIWPGSAIEIDWRKSGGIDPEAIIFDDPDPQGAEFKRRKEIEIIGIERAGKGHEPSRRPNIGRFIGAAFFDFFSGKRGGFDFCHIPSGHVFFCGLA